MIDGSSTSANLEGHNVRIISKGAEFYSSFNSLMKHRAIKSSIKVIAPTVKWNTIMKTWTENQMLDCWARKLLILWRSSFFTWSGTRAVRKRKTKFTQNHRHSWSSMSGNWTSISDSIIKRLKIRFVIQSLHWLFPNSHKSHDHSLMSENTRGAGIVTSSK